MNTEAVVTMRTGIGADETAIRQACACCRRPRLVAAPARNAAARINLALQGGGAHGAYTWGVLDALLEDGRLGFEGLSGSSAGAMNAVVLADGWARGGRDGARAALDRFWTAIGRQIPFGIVDARQRRATSACRWSAGCSPVGRPVHAGAAQSARPESVARAARAADRLRAPALGVAVQAVRRHDAGEHRQAAHLPRTRTRRSTRCSPRPACRKIHHPIEIDGEAFWDGGYSANPAVAPLFYDCRELRHPARAAEPARSARHRPTASTTSMRASPNSVSAPTSCARCAPSRRPHDYLDDPRRRPGPARTAAVRDALPHDRSDRCRAAAAQRHQAAGARPVPRDAARPGPRARPRLAGRAPRRRRAPLVDRPQALLRMSAGCRVHGRLVAFCETRPGPCRRRHRLKAGKIAR